MPENKSPIQKLALFSLIAGDLAGYSGAGVALGWLAWAKWRAPWWVLLLASATGLTLAMVRVYQHSLRYWND